MPDSPVPYSFTNGGNPHGKLPHLSICWNRTGRFKKPAANPFGQAWFRSGMNRIMPLIADYMKRKPNLPCNRAGFPLNVKHREVKYVFGIDCVIAIISGYSGVRFGICKSGDLENEMCTLQGACGARAAAACCRKGRQGAVEQGDKDS